MIILTTMCHLIIFLNGPHMSDPGHHTLQILTQPMQVFLYGFMKDTLYKNTLHKTEELKKENSAAVISISEETLAAVV